jgi:CO/xanthine dehydrogenase Mo-binding subunit
MNAGLSRRSLLAGGGALVVSFTFGRGFAAEPATPELPGSLKTDSLLDAWIKIGPDGKVTVFTGKAELGQGVKTAILQLAAEELDVDPHGIALITADTALTPNEGYTAGSQSVENSGVAVQNAAAQVREILIGLAAARLNLPTEALKTRKGFVVTTAGTSVGYGDLVQGDVLHVPAKPQSRLKDPKTYTIVGRDFARVDIPAKVTGGVAYSQDLRLPGMVHARVVRPPNYHARLADLDTSETEKVPGLIKIVRDGSYLAVVTEREEQAIRAMQALAAGARWDQPRDLPDETRIHDVLHGLPDQSQVILDRHDPAAPAAKTLAAAFHRPYQMHGPIGPSCAVGLFKEDGTLTLWSHTQGVFPLRAAVAELLGLPPDRVHVTHMEGSGCYGHDGSDDAGADAALIARAVSGRPVRVQWMREQEHGFEPYGPAMSSNVRGGIDASGRIVDWQYEVWSNEHSTRPGGAGNLLPGWLIAKPFTQPVPTPIPLPTGGGDRNALPLYKIPTAHIVYHFIPDMPLRVSALRSLGAYHNVFSIECFMDELAAAAGVDPVAFRLAHLDDPRARDAIKLAAERFGWSAGARPAPHHGRGFAFAQYKNHASYFAIAIEVAIDHETGGVRLLRAVAATDSGQPINPNGIRNQMEGGIIQSASWTLYEAVGFSTSEITTRDWSSYPILRFNGVPEVLEVNVIDRPGAPFLGAGEAAQGPTAAAIANAVADATGVRMRDLPLTAKRVKAAIGV